MIKKSEKEWRKILTPGQYRILREKGTEPPFSGRFVESDKKGRYVCAACGNVLFDSRNKYDSSCGWPSFNEARKGSVEFRDDRSHGMSRTEVVCSRCGSHLGHVFDDGPKPTGKRFCINSLSLGFREQE